MGRIKKMNSKGLELSINFIVMLIIGIVVFGFGLKILFDIVTLQENVPDFTPAEQILRNKVSAGEKVAVYPGTIVVNRGQNDIFGVAVLNTEVSSQSFEILLTPTPGISFAHSIPPSFNLQPNEVRIFKVIVKGENKGQYGVKIDVNKGTDLYDSKTVFVTVK